MITSTVFNIIDLPLREYEPGNSTWPEKVLRRDNKPTFYVTQYPALGCIGLLLTAPKGAVISVAPSSSRWKHDDGFEPEPVQGGGRQLAWLGAVHRSAEKARQLKADLKAAGFAHDRFRRGLLPYEGGACFGAPSVGVSNRSGPDLSPYLFRAYLIPDSKHSLDCCITEFERLAMDLGPVFMRPIAEDSLWDCRIPTLVYNDYDSDPTLSRDAVLFCQRGERYTGCISQIEVFELIESSISKEIEAVEAGDVPDFLSSNPFLVDEAVRLPVPIGDYLAESSLASMGIQVEVLESERIAIRERREAMERICALRSRLIRLVDWPVCYLGAHRGLVHANLYYRDKGPSTNLPYDARTELTAYLESIARRFPVLSVSFLESVWSD